MSALVRRAQRAIAVGDSVQGNPAHAARAYARGLDLLLAHCMLAAAAACADAQPLEAIALLQRVERAAGRVHAALPIAAAAYQALGHPQIARAFLNAASSPRALERGVA